LNWIFPVLSQRLPPPARMICAFRPQGPYMAFVAFLVPLRPLRALRALGAGNPGTGIAPSSVAEGWAFWPSPVVAFARSRTGRGQWPRGAESAGKGRGAPDDHWAPLRRRPGKRRLGTFPRQKPNAKARAQGPRKPQGGGRGPERRGCLAFWDGLLSLHNPHYRTFNRGFPRARPPIMC
jgi:hypothetical protein